MTEKDEATPVFSRGGAPADTIISALVRDSFQLRRPPYYHWQSSLIPDVGIDGSLDAHNRAIRQSLRRKEMQLRSWKLAISFAQRMQRIGPILSGISQAGKTTTYGELNNVPLPQPFVKDWHNGSGCYDVARIKMKTNRQVRPTEAAGSLEYQFVTVREGEAILLGHERRRQSNRSTGLIAATRYAGRSYYLELSAVLAALESGKPIIYPWQREFALAMSIVFPVSTVIELLPEWGLNLVMLLRKRTPKQKNEGSHGWICRAVTALVQHIYKDEEQVRWDRVDRDNEAQPGQYPRPRDGQCRTDYHWRLLYAVASILEVLRDLLEQPAVPMVNAIRLVPFGEDEDMIRFYDNDVATELAEHSILLQGSALPFRFWRLYEDLPGARQRLVNYLEQVNTELDGYERACKRRNEQPYARLRLDYSTNPYRWTNRYGLTTDAYWRQQHHNADGPYGYSYAYRGAAGNVGDW